MSIPRAIDNNDPRGESGTDALEAHAAPDWLLVGKLAPPEQRITVASREALLKRLDESLSRSLSVIVSPPGLARPRFDRMVAHSRDAAGHLCLLVDPRRY